MRENKTEISKAVKPVTNKLQSGDFIDIYGIPCIVSVKADGSLRATYLSDGSYHDNFVPGMYKETLLSEGQTVNVTVGPQN